jgi:hypothetical protein
MQDKNKLADRQAAHRSTWAALGRGPCSGQQAIEGPSNDKQQSEKNKEQVAPKVEKLKGSQPSGSSGKEQPSKSVKESWYEMAMQEASRSMFKGSKFSKKGPNEMAGIAFGLEGATDQVD